MAPQKWEQPLRRQIRDNHGNGWNVIAQSGKCKLTRRYEDGTKSAKVLSIEWKATNSVQILNAVTRVRELVETRNISNQLKSLVTALLALLFGGDCHCCQRRFIGSAALW